MAKRTYPYEPDHAVPPGWVLEGRLRAEGLSDAEFAQECGCSADRIRAIVAGKSPVTSPMAEQFERVLGVHRDIWLNIEADYRRYQARAAATAARSVTTLAESLLPAGPVALAPIGGLLGLYVAYRLAIGSKIDRGLPTNSQSPPAGPDLGIAVAHWLHQIRKDARQQDCEPFDKDRFRQNVRTLRRLPREPVSESLPTAKRLCNAAGVALVLAPPLAGELIVRAVWWMPSRKAVIQVCDDHADERLWSSLFDGADYILLHGRKRSFVDCAA